MICIGPTYVCDLVYVCDLHGIYLAFTHVSLIFNLHAGGSGKRSFHELAFFKFSISS